MLAEIVGGLLVVAGMVLIELWRRHSRKRREAKRAKQDLVKTLYSESWTIAWNQRAGAESAAFFLALNSIPAVFNDDSSAMESYERLRANPSDSAEAVPRLIRELAERSGLNPRHFEGATRLTPANWGQST